MNLSRFFIDRPIFAGVLSLLIFIAGVITLRALPISEYPEVVPPSVVVNAQYPGANPKVIAETVATPLEESINGVENMLYMGSQATTDGHLTLTVTFRLGTDPDKAQQQVQNRVAQAEARLPEEVRRLGVTTVKSSPDLTMVVHLVSPNERYDMTYLRNYALLNVKDRLTRIEGVGQVGLFGAGDYSMRVWLDPRKVAERGLSASDVVRAIREQNVQAAAGVVGASPGVPDVQLQLSINAQGRLRNEEEFGDIIVKTGADGAVTRLRDIARLELGASDYALRSLLDNKPAVAIGIFAAPGSNALQISDNVRATMAEVKRAMPEGVDYRIVYDPTQFVRASIRSVVETLFEAILLVVLVVILFLQTWRASIIPLLAVPVSIVGTFSVLYLLRLLDQRAHALRPGARHRHRGGRRDRGGGERGAQHRGGVVAPRGHLSRDARGLRAHHRHRARAGGGVRAARVHQRAFRPVLPPVRGHHRDLDGDLRDQLADAFPRARRAAVEGPRRAAGCAHARHGRLARLALPRVQPLVRRAAPARTPAASAASCRARP